MDLPLFLAFLAAATLLTVTPGVDTAMVLRSAASEGPRAGVLAGVGISVGMMLWALAVSLGLGALLQASQLAYTVLKWAGAAYLVWVGLKLLVKPRSSFAADDGRPAASGRAAFARGLLTNLLNPKIGVFYVTFLPQFIPHGANVGAYAFFLAAVHVALTAIWFAMLILATVPLGALLRRAAFVRNLDRLTGSIFIAFGVRLAVSKA